MRFLHLFFLFILVFLFQTSFAQVDDIENETSLPKLIQINSDFIFNDDFLKSLPSGKRLVELDSLNSNYNYRYGFALLQTSAFLNESLPYLEIAAKNVKKEPDLTGYKEKKAPYDAVFYYALANHRYGKIDAAKEGYEKYLTLIGSKNPNYQAAQLLLVQANNAFNIHESEKVNSVKSVTDVNTEYSEYSSVVSFDGSALYFTSPRPWEDGFSTPNPNSGVYNEDIYVCFLDKSIPCIPTRLEFCTRTDNEASISISLDERTFYTYSSETGNGDIYTMDYFNGEYQRPYILNNKQVNTDKFQPHYYLSADGKTAIFSSENEKGGYGGLDLYMIKKNKDGSWTAPENLGPEINTKYNEDAPFLTFDNKYLYFSSNNEQSIGGYDIFRSEWKDGKFRTPENLGTPINSTYDDIFYTTTADGSVAYLSSFRKYGMGNMDIYRVEYDGVQTEASILYGKVYFVDRTDSIPDYISVDLRCVDCEDEANKIFPRLRDGVFMANLEKCKNYEIHYLNDDTKEELAVQSLNTTCENQFEEIHRELGIKLHNDKIYANIDYVLIGNVADKQTNKKLSNVTIQIQDEAKNTISSLTTNDQGSFESSVLDFLLKGENYTIAVEAAKETYITVVKDFAVQPGNDKVIDLGTIYLDQPEVGKDLGEMIALNPIYYDFDKWNIRPDAEIELNKIIKAMNDNPKMVIELGSHTDCRGNDSYNLKLSDRRAKSAANYIKKRIQNGNQRIVGKGYGETRPVENCSCDDCSEEQHQLNRRTEFVIKKF